MRNSLFPIASGVPLSMTHCWALCVCLLLLPGLTMSADSVQEPETVNVEEIYNNAMNGDVNAQYLLFTMYRSGVGVERNIETAKRWLHSAGNSGHVEAQYWLGYIYFTGQGVERSVPKALEWYEQSARQGFVPAEFTLGHLYNGMRYRFMDRVPDKAIYWYTQAAEHDNVQAILILGCKEYYGIDLEADKALAIKWFTKASSLGEASAYEYYLANDEKNLQELCNRVPRS